MAVLAYSIFLIYLINVTRSIGQMPLHVISKHLAPSLTDSEISLLAATNSQIHTELRLEICTRAQITLQRLITFLSTTLNHHQGNILIPSKFNRTFGNSQYFPFISRNSSDDTRIYLTLFTMDSTMHISFFMRTITTYKLSNENILSFDAQHRISERCNLIRRLISNHDISSCIHSDLHRHFVNITNSTKYQNVYEQWSAMPKLISEDDVMASLWHDLIFVIKKDIVKILTGEIDTTYGVQLFHNDHWLLLIDELIKAFFMIHATRKDIVSTKAQIVIFYELVSELYNEITMYNGSEYEQVHLLDYDSELFVSFREYVMPHIWRREKERLPLKQEIFWKGMTFCYFHSRVLLDVSLVHRISYEQAKHKLHKLQTLRYELMIMMFQGDVYDLFNKVIT